MLRPHRRARGEARKTPRGPEANHAGERPRRAAAPASHPATLVSHPHNRGSRIQPSHADHQKEPIPGQPEISMQEAPKVVETGSTVEAPAEYRLMSLLGKLADVIGVGRAAGSVGPDPPCGGFLRCPA